jgi:hypothetical protein
MAVYGRRQNSSYHSYENLTSTQHTSKVPEFTYQGTSATNSNEDQEEIKRINFEIVIQFEKNYPPVHFSLC